MNLYRRAKKRSTIATLATMVSLLSFSLNGQLIPFSQLPTYYITDTGKDRIIYLRNVATNKYQNALISPGTILKWASVTATNYLNDSILGTGAKPCLVTLNYFNTHSSSGYPIKDSAWTLYGNAGTSPATNFIGTTDTASIFIKLDNTLMGVLSSNSSSVIWGKNMSGLKLAAEPNVYGLGASNNYGDYKGVTLIGDGLTATGNQMIIIGASSSTAYPAEIVISDPMVFNGNSGTSGQVLYSHVTYDYWGNLPATIGDSGIAGSTYIAVTAAEPRVISLSGIIPGTYGGTGINNGSNTCTWNKSLLVPNDSGTVKYGVNYQSSVTMPTITSTAAGTTGQVLIATTGAAPSWGTYYSGTVTSFSSGNLSPLFTTSVANATTTPALSFSLTNQTANLFYGTSKTAGSQAPSFQTIYASMLGTSWDTNLANHSGSQYRLTVYTGANTLGNIINSVTAGALLQSGTASAYPSFITTIGSNITYNGAIIKGTYGGTGINNGGNTCTWNKSTTVFNDSSLAQYGTLECSSVSMPTLFSVAPGAATYVWTSNGTSSYPSWQAAAGGGTVTSFSSGNLSPLFTTSVANATTTPALSFSLTNQTAKLFYGTSKTAGSQAPSFQTIYASVLGTSWDTALASHSGSQYQLTDYTGANALGSISNSVTAGALLQSGTASAYPSYVTTIGSNITYNGAIITGTYGGTGINNGSNTCTWNTSTTVFNDSSLAKYGTLECSSVSMPTCFSVAPGAATYVWTSNGTSSYPSWQAAAGGGGSGWGLTGNAGTNSGTNFYGTTDTAMMKWRWNNIPVARLDFADSNIYIGQNVGIHNEPPTAPTFSCTVYDFPLTQPNLLARCGGYNTAIGTNSFQQNTIGNFNTALGFYSLNGNVSGSYNTAVGGFALYINSSGTGNNNTAIGYNSISTNTTGTGNTGCGDASLRNNGSGGNNVAVGNYCIPTSVTASFNTAVGSSALYALLNSGNPTLSSYNTVIGGQSCKYAGYNTATIFEQNFAAGYNSAYYLYEAKNCDIIGYNTIGGNSSQNSYLVSSVLNGAYSCYNLLSGKFITAIGDSSLYNNTTGNYNTAIGYGALLNSTTGSINTAIGYLAGTNISSGVNNVCIGNSAGAVFGDISNAVFFGNSANSSKGFLYNHGNGYCTWSSDTAGGSGTVTSFSSGNLSPLFTTSVANATTTPALSFSLSTVSPHNVLMGYTGGSASAPTFRNTWGIDLTQNTNWDTGILFHSYKAFGLIFDSTGGKTKTAIGSISAGFRAVKLQ